MGLLLVLATPAPTGERTGKRGRKRTSGGAAKQDDALSPTTDGGGNVWNFDPSTCNGMCAFTFLDRALAFDCKRLAAGLGMRLGAPGPFTH